MDERLGWRAFVRALREEAPYWAQTLPALPRLAHRALAEDRIARLERALERLERESRRRNALLRLLILVLLAALAAAGWMLA